MILGSHVSFSNEQLLGCVRQTLGYGGNTFMFYTGAPQNSIRKALDDNYTKEAHKLMQENNIDINNVVCHAPYIINLANKTNLEKYEFSINFLIKEIKRCEAMGITKLILHPGNAVNITKEQGIKNITEALNKIVDSNTRVTILLETMAGKGSEVGSSIDELRDILEGIENKNKFGICLDTCHLNDAGYNMVDFNQYLELFDKIIGIDKIWCIHINDSKNERNTHKDRHANIGLGTIGFQTLINIIYNDKIKGAPKILETPYVLDNPPYKFEIEMIKNKKFNNTLIEDIINYYK